MKYEEKNVKERSNWIGHSLIGSNNKVLFMVHTKRVFEKTDIVYKLAHKHTHT